MFQLHCPLSHTLEIGPEHFGQRLMCPVCQAVVHAWPPKHGEAPTAKYEVACSKGHILRVKQKYLGKEIRCPSCQELVSMKPRMLLNAEGKTLGEAMPGAFKKQPPPRRDDAKKRQSPPVEVNIPDPTQQSSRIPPPPVMVSEGDSVFEEPPRPEVMEDKPAPAQPARTISPATVPDEDFEFEVVDTQFNLEIKALGLDIPASASLSKERLADVKKEKKQRGKKPAESMAPPPVQAPPPRRQPPPSPNLGSSGLEMLSGSEMMKVPRSAISKSLDVGQPTALVQFHCPNGHLLEVEAQYRGSNILCPTCQVIFQLPHG